MDEFWGEPISVYTDAQAVEDGILIDISGLRVILRGLPVNRMTSNLSRAFEPFVRSRENPCFPSLAQVLRTKCELAVDKEGDGFLLVLPGGGSEGPIWAVRNEVGGYTVMFASDY